MGKFRNAVSGILKRGGLAFTCFPASMVFAILMAGLSIWLIYAEPSSNERLWTSLQLSLLSASVAGIAFSAFSRVFKSSARNFMLANISAAVFAGIAFTLLFLVKGTPAAPETKVIVCILGLSAAALFAFLAIPSFRNDLIDYNKMFFMTIKSFFIAFLYSGVLMAGFSFVAFAVERLLWNDLDEKVYMYILVVSLLVGYAFFLGYFPDFSKKETDGYRERAETAVKQPRFAEILFQNIMIPIVAALSVVLLVWSVKIIITGDWPRFTQIAGIFTAYSLSSIVLYLLVSSYDNKLVKWYRRINPVATLIFLGFEAYPIIEKISSDGLKTFEYSIIMLWIFAAIVSACFIFLPVIKNRVVSYTATALLLVLMLPFAGVIDAPVYAQSARLKAVLQRNDMLEDGTIKAKGSISNEDKIKITDAINFLYYRSENEGEIPAWLKSNLQDPSRFSTVFGFDEKFSGEIDEGPQKASKYYSINIRDEALDIEGFKYLITSQTLEKSNRILVGSGADEIGVELSFKGDRGYVPVLVIYKGSEKLAEEDLAVFAQELFTKHFGDGDGVSGDREYTVLSGDELSKVIMAGETKIKITLSSVEYYYEDGELSYTNVRIFGISIG